MFCGKWFVYLHLICVINIGYWKIPLQIPKWSISEVKECTPSASLTIDVIFWFEERLITAWVNNLHPLPIISDIAVITYLLLWAANWREVTYIYIYIIWVRVSNVDISTKTSNSVPTVTNDSISNRPLAELTWELFVWL